MSSTVHLQIEATAGGSWRVTIDSVAARDDADRASSDKRCSARLDAAQVRRIRRALERSGPPAGHAIAIGRAMTAVLEASAAIAGAFGEARGAARARGERLLVAIDASDRAVATMPWELLTGTGEAGPLEEIGDAFIARLAAGLGDARRPASTGLSSRIWSLVPADEAISATVTGTCIRYGVATPTASTIAVPPDHALLTHLIVEPEHAEHVEGLLTDTANRLSGDGVLRTLVARSDLVVVHLASDDTAQRIGQLGDRLIAAGARAALIADRALTAVATTALVDGIYLAITRGASIPSAAASARAALAAVSDTIPWYAPRLTLGDLGSAHTGLMRHDRRPARWPLPNPDAARMIEQAYAIAEQSGSGFVGIEHLALALIAATPRASLARLRYQLSTRRREIESQLGGFSPIHSEPHPLTPTPRLGSMADRLEPGFDADTLWTVIAEVGEPTLRVLLGEPRRRLPPPRPFEGIEATEMADTVEEPAGPAGGLEVVGGPEDGRRLEPMPGDGVGRASGSRRAEHRLYDGTLLTDPALSRRHLVWLGPGRLRLESSIHHPRVSKGELDMHVGMLVGLTRSTWLRGTASTMGDLTPHELFEG